MSFIAICASGTAFDVPRGRTRADGSLTGGHNGPHPLPLDCFTIVCWVRLSEFMSRFLGVTCAGLVAWNVGTHRIDTPPSFPDALQEEPSVTPTSSRRLTRRRFAIATVAASAATAASASLARYGGAADATPPPPVGATVIAENLVNPRFLAIAGDGAIYVTEVGTGGDGLLNRGYSGRISRIAPGGTVDALVSGLVSYAEGVGPSGVTLLDDALFFAQGGVAVDREQQPLPEENTLNRVDPATGGVTLVAELGVYEVENNPDVADISTNLYAMAPRPDGTLVVPDAGANVLYGVDPATGEFDLLRVIPGLPRITGREPAPGERQRQSVPTAVAVDGDGLIHVSLLSQRWPADGPSILTVSDDGTFTPILLGGSMIVSIAFGPDGSLYFSQLFDVFGGDSQVGSVRRVREDRTSEPVIEGLTLPHGIAFDAGGNLFVVTNSLLSTPEATLGQLLRFDGIASA